MFNPYTEKWPPAYDEEELAASINSLVSSTTFEIDFYQQSATSENLPFYQGDIISLNSPLPLIHKDGEPGITGDFNHWLLIGNTCDISRDITDVEHTQIIPIMDLGLIKDTDPTTIETLRRYSYSRRFYIPPWNSSIERILFADFTKPVTLHKQAFEDHISVVASLSLRAWILLNACQVRFIARGDGRNN